MEWTVHLPQLQHASAVPELRTTSPLGEGAGRAAVALGVDLVKPTTLIGLAALAEPDLLFEVEAVAVLP